MNQQENGRDDEPDDGKRVGGAPEDLPNHLVCRVMICRIIRG
jgi:hypothetical protein